MDDSLPGVGLAPDVLDMLRDLEKNHHVIGIQAPDVVDIQDLPLDIFSDNTEIVIDPETVDDVDDVAPTDIDDAETPTIIQSAVDGALSWERRVREALRDYLLVRLQNYKISYTKSVRCSMH